MKKRKDGTLRAKRLEKKKRIIEAVQRVLAKEGYQGVTMKRVAAEAGISQGLLHYYFADKEEMMVETMRENLNWVLRLYSETFSRIQPGDDVAGILVDQFRALVNDNPDFYNIFLECWPLLMHTTEEMRGINKELFEVLKESILENLDQLARGACIRPKIPLKDLTALSVALFDGMAFQIQADPALAGDEGLWRSAKECLRPWLGQDE